MVVISKDGEIVVEGGSDAGREIEPARSHLAKRHSHAAGAGENGSSHHRPCRLVAHPDVADALLAPDRMQERRELAAGDAERE